MKTLSARDIFRLATAPIEKGVTVDMTNAVIEEPIDLSGCALGNVDFSGSVFLAPIVAREAVFAGLAWFKSCRFEALVDVSRATFRNDLRMKGARFSGPASFSRAEFHGMADFDQARFEDRVDLDGLIAFGNMSMGGTRFDGAVTLQGSSLMGGLWCEGATFASRVDFRDVEVHGRTWLRGMRLAAEGGPAGAGRGVTREIRSFGYRWY
jgi:uncharacterized protein YjbI with pentapeptide repeats